MEINLTADEREMLYNLQTMRLVQVFKEKHFLKLMGNTRRWSLMILNR